MISILVAAVLAQSAPYVRTRVEAKNARAHCLWWGNPNIRFNQSQAGNDDTVGDSEFAAISTSWKSWQNAGAACSSLTIEEGPRVSNRHIGFDPDLPTNINLMLFRKRVCPRDDGCWEDDSCMNKYDCWAYDSATIAVTTTAFDSQTGEILDADIEMNASRFHFTTVNPPAPACAAGLQNQSCIATDVENTMTHEVGHALGLDHTDFRDSTMNPTAPLGETAKRSIDSGSTQFLCDAYPKNRPPQDCVALALPSDGRVGVRPGCDAGATSLATAALLVSALAPWARRRRRMTG